MFLTWGLETKCCEVPEPSLENKGIHSLNIRFLQKRSEKGRNMSVFMGKQTKQENSYRVDKALAFQHILYRHPHRKTVTSPQINIFQRYL